MQQNANLAKISNTLVMESTQSSPIAFINGQVLDVIASLKSTGDQLFEKTRKIDEKLDQIDAQFQQHMHQSSQKIYSEIERSRTISANSLNEIRQVWEIKLKETADIYSHESHQIFVDGQRSISEAICTLKADSDKALHSYLDQLESQLTESKDQHKSMIADFKKQLSTNFANFIKETRQELDSAKEGTKEVFDRKLDALLKSISDFTKEIENNKNIVDLFIGQTKTSLQSMIYEFQIQHDFKIKQAADKLLELESKTNNFLETTNSEFENRWLNLVNTHNQNLKSFRDSLKEAIVDKVSQQAKKRLDSIHKEFKPVLDRIINSQEALRGEMLSLCQKEQNNHIQNESAIKNLKNEVNVEKKKSRIWILFVTLFFSSIFVASHYFSW